MRCRQGPGVERGQKVGSKHMMDRKKFKWSVTLQAEDGQVVKRPVEAYWSPEHEGTAEAVGEAAMAEAYWASRKKMHFAPISVERVAA